MTCLLKTLEVGYGGGRVRVQGMERRWRILVEEKEGEKERLRKNKKKNKGRIEFPSRPLLIVNRLEIRKKNPTDMNTRIVLLTFVEAIFS